MKRTIGVLVGVGALVLFASQQRFVEAQGRGGNPAAQQAAAEARAKQEALEKATPQLQFTEEILPLTMPDHTIGETEGVSMNSKGPLFVYSRTGKGGMARGGTAAELFEFDQNYKFVKQWAPDQYGASFAHSVRIDKNDNVWFVDEGSSMVVKMDTERYPVGGVGTFGRPTDVAWDAQDNIYVSDGYTNSRFVKLAKDGAWVKAIGTHGNGPDQFSTPHGIASDGQLVYVADRGNNRIQIYDGASMTFKTSYTGVGAPWSVQVTQKYVYSGDGTGKIYRLDKATGKLLGWIQTGMGQGQTGCIIHSLHAVSDNQLIKGSCSEWNVEKITFKGTSATQ